MAQAQTALYRPAAGTELAQGQLTLLPVVIKTIVTHSITYFIVGWLASSILDYAGWYAASFSSMMRPLTDPVLMLAPMFQPLRGILFGLAFYLLREPLFNRKNGWLVMWAVLVVFGILGTFGPTPGSLEGMFFTVFPLADHLRGLPEVLLQALLLSAILFYWVNHPEKRWLTWGLAIVFVIFMAFPILGIWATQLR